MRISDYLNADLVSFLEVKSRDEAMYALIDVLQSKQKLESPKAFTKAIFAREELVSTGIGMGVAIPHAKLKELSDFFIVIGIQKGKGLDWNSLDEAPVKLIFMIGGPEDRQTEYLQILSLLTSAIRDINLRKSLLQADSVKQVLELFSQV